MTEPSVRAIVTDDSIHIVMTIYEGADRLARVELSPMTALMVADKLFEVSLRHLMADEEARKKFL